LQAKSKEIPKHVADYYQLLSADELIEDVLYHYRKNVWPLIEDIVTFPATDLHPTSLFFALDKLGKISFNE
jgi:hypothetical protein